MYDNPVKTFAREAKAFNDVLFFSNEILEQPLFPKQQEILHEFYKVKGFDYDTNRQVPSYNELVLIAGMRSGKTTLASVAACFETFRLITLRDPQKYFGLAKNAPIFIINVASSEQQAKDTVYANIKARIDGSNWFQNQKMDETKTEFYFPDINLKIRAEHSKSGSLAGKTNKMVIYDEMARFQDGDGENSAASVYNTIGKGTKTFGMHGKAITITSPLLENEFSEQLLQKCGTINDPSGFTKQAETTIPSMLGYRFATWMMNPKITRLDLESEFIKDPEKAKRDWEALPSTVLEKYYRETWRIDLCVNDKYIHPIEADGITLAPWFVPKPGIQYVMAGDPALKNDNFGVALGHIEPGAREVVVDLAHAVNAEMFEGGREIDAAKLKTFLLEIARRFPLACIRFDTWHFPETTQALAKQTGLEIEQNFVNKKEHDMLKDAIYSRACRLPKFPLLLTELKALELVRATKVDHPRGGSKDVADAVANVVAFLRDQIPEGPPVAVSVSHTIDESEGKPFPNSLIGAHVNLYENPYMDD